MTPGKPGPGRRFEEVREALVDEEIATVFLWELIEVSNALTELKPRFVDIQGVSSKQPKDLCEALGDN